VHIRRKRGHFIIQIQGIIRHSPSWLATYLKHEGNDFDIEDKEDEFEREF
jgi:hypothetical protein